jgi:type IV pilus assembly protein PilY1
MNIRKSNRGLLGLGVLGLCLYASNGMAVTDLANEPMGTVSSVKPNVMFILDDSQSMSWDFLPDNIRPQTSTPSSSTNYGPCRINGAGTNLTTSCDPGDPPYYSAAVNGVFYDPQTVYATPLGYKGTAAFAGGTTDAAGNQSSSNVYVNPFFSTTTLNILTKFPETIYCTTSTAPVTDTNLCKRNGIGGVGYAYPDNTKGTGVVEPVNHYAPYQTNAVTGNPIKGLHATRRQILGAPFYYDVVPAEFCDSEKLTSCKAANTSGSTPVAPDATFIYPAYVRYCVNSVDAFDTAVVTGNTTSGPVMPRCAAKYSSTYQYARYGKFVRTDIVPATPSYPNRPGRYDCATPGTCTYAEEIQNFANWYAYYRTRMAMMKTAASRAFSRLDTKYRVGFMTINPTGGADSGTGNMQSYLFQAVAPFDPTVPPSSTLQLASQKGTWYDTLFQIDPTQNTPLKTALSRAGRYFAGVPMNVVSLSDGSVKPVADPVQYSCQRNYSVLTTDGYWNSFAPAGLALDGTNIGNVDNVVSPANTAPYIYRATGTYDGNVAGASGTLADVAAYYYGTPLRATTQNVPTSSKDPAPFQHMTTYTLGLVAGDMYYKSDYETALTGDFAEIKAGTRNWPMPVGDTPSALDDLWHAGVNGHGAFYSATNPTLLQAGLDRALASITSLTGAAAASATSSPNISITDNYIFSTTYESSKWEGQVIAERIDPATGKIAAGVVATAQDKLDLKVGTSSDTRTILTFDSTAADHMKDFLYGSMSASEAAQFDGHCTAPNALNQCGGLSVVGKLVARDGNNIVNYLRGQKRFETTIFRARTHTLGDTVGAKPAYVGPPNYGYTDIGYLAYKGGSAAARRKMVYVGANDGMLHGFDVGLNERWAYVPHAIYPNLYKLANDNYATNHQFYVDGSPETMDIQTSGGWKTILVGGLNRGGTGYYALDITDPDAPKALWEFCADATLCSSSDANLGYSYGNPVITKRPGDGKWVVIVTSGYNNSDGKGYFYVLDAQTGAKLGVVPTGVGSPSSPAGLAKIGAWADDSITNNTATKVYGGDLLGNVWRFDLGTTLPSAATRIATLLDGAGRPQPVTTRPELSLINGQSVVFVATGKYLGNSDLTDPATHTPAETSAYQQSVYAFKDIPVVAGLPSLRAAGGNLVQQSILVTNSTTRSMTANPVDWTTDNGWYFDLNPVVSGVGQSPGERVNVDMQLYQGLLLIPSNVPDIDPCTTGGSSWLYQIAFKTGSFVPGNPAATKLGNALITGLNVVTTPDGTMRAIGKLSSGDPVYPPLSTPPATSTGRRVMWREID